MKKKKKVIAIALIGAILSILIYFITKNNNLTIVAIGDSLAEGMTAYNIKGYSFNDYLKEDYQNKKLLKKYYEYTHSNKTIKELIYEIKENKVVEYNNEKIELQQAISEADILTIAIGEDELSNIKITKNVKDEFQHNLEELLSMIHVLNNKKVFILGIYKTKNADLLTISKINAIIRDVAISNDFTFIDINHLLADQKYYFDNQSYEINYLGHKAIYEELKKCL